MKKLIKIVLVSCVLFLMQSCYYDTVYEGPVEPPIDPEVPVSYKTQIMPIWNTDCVSCHKGSTAPDLRPENSYASLIDGGYVIQGDAVGSTLYKTLIWADGVPKMPTQYKLSNSEIELVKVWIEQGAKNN